VKGNYVLTGKTVGMWSGLSAFRDLGESTGFKCGLGICMKMNSVA